ncbi:cytochrome b [Sphingomonas hengshuiensis]|uniref:Polyisoprenoid-binding protein n=1 Tax=Sphingomonas hengshuiensis TaxID=1609977 RepID=A0A7U4JAE2_9SPHN|nr:cytochrome b [Sphingomonas hengshuiensis]AJP73187.1 polyisoprenoid-binding protein [Sphingomonas hengshuiensis]
MRENERRYSTVSILLHWTIFVLIFTNATVGGWMEDASGPAKLGHFALHKSLGITILVLTLARIGWRLTHRWPPFPANMATWERVLARGTHIAFYALTLSVPLLGWAAASAGGAPATDWFGLFPVGNLPIAESQAAGEQLGGIHKLLVKAIYVVLALHVLGALKHHFLNRDWVLHRMLPVVPMWRRRD